MYSGFITHRHTIKRLGTHQRLDMAAYRMVRHYFSPGSFPPLKQILHFEGVNGPDGLKVKSPGAADPDHFYNPETDSGELPEHLGGHYHKLVEALVASDMVRAAFEASWLAHYVVDGLTPAHHVLMSDELERIGAAVQQRGKLKYLAFGQGALKKNWAIWGGRGMIPTHHNFEIGIAATLVGRPLRVELDETKLVRARQIGYMAFFKEEAGAIAKLDLYNEFRAKGWTATLAASVKNQIIPAQVQTVGVIWLLAYLQSQMESVKTAALAAVA